MAPFEPRQVGSAFYAELEGLITQAQSAVILAPRYGGKRRVLREIVSRAQRRGLQPLGHLRGRRSQPLNTIERLANSMATALGTTVLPASAVTNGNGFETIERLASETGKPVILFAENVDTMAHHIARSFLEGVRTHVEARRLVVLLTGEHDLRDLVHGPKSEFNCANQFILQGYGADEFATSLQEFSRTLCLDLTGGTAAGDAFLAERLYALTGGSLYWLRMVLLTLVEQRVRHRGDRGITVDDLRQVSIDDTVPAVYFSHLPRYAVQLVSWEPDCWPDLEQLLEGGAVPRLAGSPGTLEFAGFAVQRQGRDRLEFASELMRDFARRYYTPRRLADLYARKGDWDKAFVRYGKLPKDEILRPSDADDRIEVEAAVRALGAAMHANVSRGIARLKALLVQGCQKLLGFEEVTFWSFDRKWTRDGGDSVSDVCLSEIPSKLPVSQTVTPGLYPLSESTGRYALAAILKGLSSEQRCAVTLSNLRSRLVTSRERERLGRELLHHFVDAHGRAVDAEANQRRLAARDKHLDIVNTIVESIGTLDVKTLLKLAASGLRGLGYKRVLFCLVDPRRKRIVGVHDDSDDHVNLAEMTDYPLSDPKRDIQPHVISTGRPKIVAEASAEPLASSDAVKAARLEAFAIVPILSRTGEAIGTIHIERFDGAVPTRTEVDDLMLFGRQLAIVIIQSERLHLLQSALDKSPEPVLITDQFELVRYANAEAASVFGLRPGWKEVHDAERLDGPGLDAAVIESVRHTLRAEVPTTLFLPSIGTARDYRGTMFVDHVDDWRKMVVGSVLHIQNQTFLYRIFEAVMLVGRAESMESALDKMIDASITLGHEWVRLYLIPASDPSRLVGVRSQGLSALREQAFNEGRIDLPPRGACPVSWRAVEEGKPVMFCWSREQKDTFKTERGLEVHVVKQPPLAEELEKQHGAYWIDVPLMTPGGAIGKLTLQCGKDLRREQFEMLGILGHQAGQLLAAFQERDRQRHERERWVTAGMEKSMTAIAHNVAARLGGLAALYAMYRARQRSHPGLQDLNDRFEHMHDNILKTIRRTKNLLSAVVAEPQPFDLRGLLQSVLTENLPEPAVWSLDGAAQYTITADDHLLESAFVELLQNSRQMIADGVALRVHVRVARIVGAGGRWTEIAIADNGPGVPIDVKPRIFEDFYSRRPGKTTGTGLGLAFVRRVILAHRGTVEECGTPERGAVFVIRLPVSDEETTSELSQ